MRKADYSMLAKIIYDFLLNSPNEQARAAVSQIAYQFAERAHVDKQKFLVECGIRS